MGTVTVDIDLDDIDTEELLDELRGRLKSRHWSEKDKEEIRIELRKILALPSATGRKIKTLADQMKYEFFMENFDRFTLEHIESLVK